MNRLCPALKGGIFYTDLNTISACRPEVQALFLVKNLYSKVGQLGMIGY